MSQFHSGLQPARTILRGTCPDLIVSKQKLKQAEPIQLVLQNREQATQTLCFNLATLAVQQQRQTIRFRTAAEMLETFGRQTGKEYRRRVDAFETVFGATIFFGTDALKGSAKMVQRSRINFMREAQIWYSRSPEQRSISTEFENVVVLSDDFYQEILAHPVPNDLEAVKVLAASPAILDTCGSVTAASRRKEPSRFQIFGEFGLANSLGCGEYSRPRRFRAMLEQWLDTILP